MNRKKNKIYLFFIKDLIFIPIYIIIFLMISLAKFVKLTLLKANYFILHDIPYAVFLILIFLIKCVINIIREVLIALVNIIYIIYWYEYKLWKPLLYDNFYKEDIYFFFKRINYISRLINYMYFYIMCYVLYLVFKISYITIYNTFILRIIPLIKYFNIICIYGSIFLFIFLVNLLSSSIYIILFSIYYILIRIYNYLKYICSLIFTITIKFYHKGNKLKVSSKIENDYSTIITHYIFLFNENNKFISHYLYEKKNFCVSLLFSLNTHIINNYIDVHYFAKILFKNYYSFINNIISFTRLSPYLSYIYIFLFLYYNSISYILLVLTLLVMRVFYSISGLFNYVFMLFIIITNNLCIYYYYLIQFSINLLIYFLSILCILFSNLTYNIGKLIFYFIKLVKVTSYKIHNFIVHKVSTYKYLNSNFRNNYVVSCLPALVNKNSDISLVSIYYSTSYDTTFYVYYNTLYDLYKESKHLTADSLYSSYYSLKRMIYSFINFVTFSESSARYDNTIDSITQKEKRMCSNSGVQLYKKEFPLFSSFSYVLNKNIQSRKTTYLPIFFYYKNIIQSNSYDYFEFNDIASSLSDEIYKDEFLKSYETFMYTNVFLNSRILGNKLTNIYKSSNKLSHLDDYLYFPYLLTDTNYNLLYDIVKSKSSVLINPKKYEYIDDSLFGKVKNNINALFYYYTHLKQGYLNYYNLIKMTNLYKANHLYLVYIFSNILYYLFTYIDKYKLCYLTKLKVSRNLTNILFFQYSKNSLNFFKLVFIFSLNLLLDITKKFIFLFLYLIILPILLLIYPVVYSIYIVGLVLKQFSFSLSFYTLLLYMAHRTIYSMETVLYLLLRTLISYIYRGVSSFFLLIHSIDFRMFKGLFISVINKLFFISIYILIIIVCIFIYKNISIVMLIFTILFDFLSSIVFSNLSLYIYRIYYMTYTYYIILNNIICNLSITTMIDLATYKIKYLYYYRYFNEQTVYSELHFFYNFYKPYPINFHYFPVNFWAINIREDTYNPFRRAYRLFRTTYEYNLYLPFSSFSNFYYYIKYNLILKSINFKFDNYNYNYSYMYGNLYNYIYNNISKYYAKFCKPAIGSLWLFFVIGILCFYSSTITDFRIRAFDYFYGQHEYKDIEILTISHTDIEKDFDTAYVEEYNPLETEYNQLYFSYNIELLPEWEYDMEIDDLVTYKFNQDYLRSHINHINSLDNSEDLEIKYDLNTIE